MLSIQAYEIKELVQTLEILHNSPKAEEHLFNTMVDLVKTVCASYKAEFERHEDEAEFGKIVDAIALEE